MNGDRESRAAQGVADGVSDAASAISNATRDDVAYHVEVSGAEGTWAVRAMSLHEELNATYELDVTAIVSGASPEVSDLLGKDCALRIERRAHQRSVKGFVRHARVRELPEGVEVRIVIAPLVWALGHNLDSRIYQAKTVPEIVQDLYDRLLGSRSRQVRSDLTKTYPRHEYIVQFQESDLTFLKRLCEQESIVFFFDHEDEHETLVLVDATSGLENVHDDGAVRFSDRGGVDPESITSATHDQFVGATDVVVGEYNWTRPNSAVRGEQTGRGEGSPTLEVYDHTSAVALYDYGGRAYDANDSASQAQSRAERLDLARQIWRLHGTVVAAAPGRIIELSGCPEGALDQRYLITSVRGSGSATEGATGGYQSGLECVPLDLPYRPARRTRRPAIPGPLSATVVGPSGEEIHTDEHGRVKVQFHWDRQGQRNEQSSCWLRVQQTWAGPSWGSWFLPRIGMEVVVQFFEGNPDQPFVTGCLYNGDNATPYPLPDEKTKSTIKTNSSPGGGGSNELRFEDKAGSEEVYIHAQKDFNEVVENNHSTHVKANQTNTVDGNQTETVTGDQEMTVHENRTKVIDKDEENTIHQNRTTTVDQNEKETIGGDRTLHVVGNETINVDKERKVVITQKTTQNHDGGREIKVKAFDNLEVADGANKNVHVTGQYNITSDGHFKVVQNSINELTILDSMYAAMVGRVQIKAGNANVHYDAMPDGSLTVKATTKITLECGMSVIEMKSDGTILIKGNTIELNGGGSVAKLEASGVTTSGSSITSSASGMHELTGLLVKIN
jgi:type VI secretion system secreted protein VgrG